MSDETMRITGPMAQAGIKELRRQATVDVGYFDEPMMRAVVLAALSTASTREPAGRVVKGFSSELGPTRTVQWVDGAPDVGTLLYVSPPVERDDVGPVAGEVVAWHKMAERQPEPGFKFVALYEDGSGAWLGFQHDGGVIDADGDEYAQIPAAQWWAYLPTGFEFTCEDYAEDPVSLPAHICPSLYAALPPPQDDNQPLPGYGPLLFPAGVVPLGAPPEVVKHLDGRWCVEQEVGDGEVCMTWFEGPHAEWRARNYIRSFAPPLDALRIAVEALEPFAERAEGYDLMYEDEDCPDWSPFIPMSAYRRAAEALAALKAEGK